jgi:hypothetical protein
MRSEPDIWGTRGSVETRPERATQPETAHRRLAAAVLTAQRRGVDRVAWVVHEFHTRGTGEAAHRANAADLDAFVARLAPPGALLPSSGALVGPVRFQGALDEAGESEGIAHYVGKAICVLDG